MHPGIILAVATLPAVWRGESVSKTRVAGGIAGGGLGLAIAASVAEISMRVMPQTIASIGVGMGVYLGMTVGFRLCDYVVTQTQPGQGVRSGVSAMNVVRWIARQGIGAKREGTMAIVFWVGQPILSHLAT
jgi:hypothetical protein